MSHGPQLHELEEAARFLRDSAKEGEHTMTEYRRFCLLVAADRLETEAQCWRAANENLSARGRR